MLKGSISKNDDAIIGVPCRSHIWVVEAVLVRWSSSRCTGHGPVSTPQVPYQVLTTGEDACLRFWDLRLPDGWGHASRRRWHGILHVTLII